MKMFSTVAAVLLAIAVLSCGTEPSEEDVSASVLSLELAGDQTAGYQVTAGWTRCQESSFEGYLLYRSEEPDIEGDLSGAMLLGSSPTVITFSIQMIRWKWAWSTTMPDDHGGS